MKALLLSAACAALIGTAGLTSAVAETKPTDTKASTTGQPLPDAECTALWTTVHGAGTGDLAMAKAQPHVSDFKKADVNGDSKLSAAEWKDACAKGYVMSKAGGAAASPMPANKPGGTTSDRTPSGASERTPGAGSTGAAGTGAGQTPEGTSDRTPKD